MSNQNTRPISTRPISVGHLVFGLVFTGIATIWLVGELTDVEAPGFALWGPAVLIGAGVVGLVASFAGSRSRSRVPATEPAEPIETAETTDTEPTAVLSDDVEETRTLDDSEEER